MGVWFSDEPNLGSLRALIRVLVILIAPDPETRGTPEPIKFSSLFQVFVIPESISNKLNFTLKLHSNGLSYTILYSYKNKQKHERQRCKWDQHSDLDDMLDLYYLHHF